MSKCFRLDLSKIMLFSKELTIYQKNKMLDLSKGRAFVDNRKNSIDRNYL